MDLACGSINKLSIFSQCGPHASSITYICFSSCVHWCFSKGQWFDPGLCRRVVYLDKKLCSTFSLSTRVYKWVPDTQQNTGRNPAMDEGVSRSWLPCDRLASHLGGVVILLITSCWVPCDGLASHPGGVVILLVATCWVPCDGLASHPGGSSNTPSSYMLGTL